MREGHLDLKRQWNALGDDIEKVEKSENWQRESPMNDAIADFMRSGGKVVKVQETIPVTVPELLEYLAACGISAEYSVSNGTFVRGQRQHTLRKLVELANTYRTAQQLPPFAMRAKV